MKITPLEEIHQYEDGQPVMAVRGAVRHIGGKKGGMKANNKPWSQQIVKIADNGSEMKLFFWDRPELTGEMRVGDVIEVQAKQDSKGKWGGLLTEFKQGNERYPDEMTLKVSLGAKMIVDGQESAGEGRGEAGHQQAPQRHPAGNRPAQQPPAREATPSDGGSTSEGPRPTDPNPAPPAPPARKPAGKKRRKDMTPAELAAQASADRLACVEAYKGLCRLGNAYKLSLHRARAIAEWDHQHAGAAVWTISEVKDATATLFIEGNKKGLFAFLPDDVDVSAILEQLGAPAAANPATTTIGQQPKA